MVPQERVIFCRNMYTHTYIIHTQNVCQSAQVITSKSDLPIMYKHLKTHIYYNSVVDTQGILLIGIDNKALTCTSGDRCTRCISIRCSGFGY